MSDETKIKFKNEMQRDEAIVYFEALLNGIKQGTVQLQQGEERLVLAPGAMLRVEVKASRKDTKERFSFELSWKSERVPEEELALGASPEAEVEAEA